MICGHEFHAVAMNLSWDEKKYKIKLLFGLQNFIDRWEDAQSVGDGCHRRNVDDTNRGQKLFILCHICHINNTAIKYLDRSSTENTYKESTYLFYKT